MKKTIFAAFYLILLSLVGCGLGKETLNKKSAATVEEVTDTWSSFAVASSSELPLCESAHYGKLYYLSSEKVFKTCSSAGNLWITIAIKGEDGENGANGVDGISGVNGTNGTNGGEGSGAGGMTILSNKLLNGSATDLCPDSTVTCKWLGGNMVIFSDGTLVLTVKMATYYTHTGNTDNDTDYESITYYIPSSKLTGAINMSSGSFWDGNNYVSAWVYFSRASALTVPVLGLYSDTNNNFVCDIASDKLELAITISDW